MGTKPPFEYELIPQEIDTGIGWVTVRLRNIGDTDLQNLAVQLHSTDTDEIEVPSSESFIPLLHPNEFENLPFEIRAQGTAPLFISVDGQLAEKAFHWESPKLDVVVGLEIAELVSFSALKQPYPTLGTPVTVEATIRGLGYNQGLGLEFWADTPNHTTISIDKLPTDPIPEGETAHYTAEFTPDRQGIYTIHAYLFAGTQRIDHAVEELSITR